MLSVVLVFVLFHILIWSRGFQAFPKIYTVSVSVVVVVVIEVVVVVFVLVVVVVVVLVVVVVIVLVVVSVIVFITVVFPKLEFEGLKQQKLFDFKMITDITLTLSTVSKMYQN